MKNSRSLVGLLALFFIVGLAVSLATVEAQEVQVKSADPSSAAQETANLVVVIRGNGFSRGAGVKFFVTGTNDAGGVAVTRVVVKGSKRIEATINVALEATVADFDIEVSASNGRRGRGTELFAVTEKGNAGAGQTITYDVVADAGSTQCIAPLFMADTAGPCNAPCGVGDFGAEIPSGGVENFNIFYCGGCISLQLAGVDGEVGTNDDIMIVRASSNMQVDGSSAPGQVYQFGFFMYDADGKQYEATGQIPIMGDLGLRGVLVGQESFVIDVDQPDYPVIVSKKSAKGDKNRDKGSICIGALTFNRRP